MPDHLKARLKTFVPPPAETKVQSFEQLPTVYDQPFERWNSRKKKQEHGTEPIPIVVREFERSAQRELFSVLRLVDAGKVTVSDKTCSLCPSSLPALADTLCPTRVAEFTPLHISAAHPTPTYTHAQSV